jgi:sulfonate transport system ATP-binding protein
MDALISPPPALSLRAIRRGFGGREVLRGVDLAIAPGEFVVLLGRSGCGKSTLLRIAGELDRGAVGDVAVTSDQATVFQDARLLPWRRVWRNVVIGLNGSRDALRARALTALAEVGLTDRADAWPRTLSGGEAQRVALARALVREPGLLLLDEPFAALDALTRLRMQRLVGRLWQRHGLAVLLVTHDIDEAVHLGDRILLMEDGRITLDLPVHLPHPRRREQSDCVALRVRLLAALGVDQESTEAEW